MKRPRLAAAAALIGIGAVLVAGFAAAGSAGLVDAAAVATLGILIVARGTLLGPKPRPVRLEELRRKLQPRTTVRAADFPAFAKISSDLEWAQMSRRDYEHLLRPTLARLAANLGRDQVLDLAGPPARDADGPGVDRATLEHIVAALEAGQLKQGRLEQGQLEQGEP
jgi:hypothetical protein